MAVNQDSEISSSWAEIGSLDPPTGEFGLGAGSQCPCTERTAAASAVEQFLDIKAQIIGPSVRLGEKRSRFSLDPVVYQPK